MSEAPWASPRQGAQGVRPAQGAGDPASPLSPILEAGGPPLVDGLAAVQGALAEAVAGPPTAGAEPSGPAGTAVELAVRAVTAGGKRLRPLLLLACAGPAAEQGAGRRRAVAAGAAIELIHAATLVHDDVLDRSALRRGRPTVWHAHGRAMATTVGDLLFGRAFTALCAVGDAAAVAELSAACRALATGELLQREDAWRTDVTIERYERRCSLKTGRLFAAAGRIGAGLAGEEVEPLGRFGDAIGVAFQLFDDVLDVVGPPEVTGKPRGTDLLDGTVTLPLLLAAEQDPELRALDLRALDAQGAATVCDRIAAGDAVARTEDRARQLVADAVAGLPDDLDARRRTVLGLVARGVVDRRL